MLQTINIGQNIKNKLNNQMSTLTQIRSIIQKIGKLIKQIKHINSKKTSFQNMQSLSDEKNCLLAILTCLICQQRATQAHICPNCSKFFCFICIQTWISQKSNQCPYCSQKLQEKQLINCQKLCADLSQALDSMGQPKHKVTKTCNQHKLQLNYYCQTCQVQVCSDCCVLTIQHQGHSFLKTSSVKRQFQKQTNRLKLLINNAKYNIQNFITKQKEYSTSFETNREKDISKFNQFVKNLKEKTQKNCHTQILALQKIIKNQKSMAKELLHVYDENLQLIKDCPKIQFVITKADQIKEKLKSYIKNLKTSNIALKSRINYYEQTKMESKILPPFTTKTFTIKSFKALHQRNQMIYTDTLRTNGLQWRLKIYPAGIPDDSQPQNQNFKTLKNIKDSYLSVFVQLKSSIRQKGKYRHKIVIQSQKVSQRIMERDFESQFQRGECWGYDKFSKIYYLYENGFICPVNDELKITLLIGPANYFEASQDLRFYLQKRKNQLLQNQKQEIQNNEQTLQE